MNTLPTETTGSKPGIRSWIWKTIHDCEGRSGQVYAFAMIFIIALSLALLPLEFFREYVRYSYVIEHFIFGVATLLTIDLILQFISAPSKRAFLRSSEFYWDALALLPFYIEGEIRFLQHIELSDTHLHMFHLLRFFLLFELTRIHSNLRKDTANVRTAFGVTPDEEISMVVSKHFIFLLLGVLLSILILNMGIGILTFFGYQLLGGGALALCSALSILVLYRTWQDYSNDGILLTNKRIIVSDSGWWESNYWHAEYSKVTRVVSRHAGLFGWLFDSGSILIEWRGGALRFPLAKGAHKAAQIILQRIGQVQTKS